jgi:hypothetical protein
VEPAGVARAGTSVRRLQLGELSDSTEAITVSARPFMATPWSIPGYDARVVKLTALFAALASGCGAPAADSAKSPPATGRTTASASAATDAPEAIPAPKGFVEGSFGDLSRDESGEGRHVIFIRGKDRGAVPGTVDDLTAEFVERFRKDRSAAITWAGSKPELGPALALASRLKRAHYELEGDTFVFRLFGADGALESDRPHVVILVSGAPFFVQIEALEGFAY